MILTFENNGSIWTDEQSTGTGAANRSGTAFSIDSNVTCEDYSIATIPRRALNPVDGIE